MISEQDYRTYLQYLLDGNKTECNRIVKHLLDENSEIRDLYVNLFQRSMYQVGELWEFNRISVATEHLATSITQQLMNLIYPRLFAGEKTGKKVLIAGVANEYHQLGPQMVSDIFEFNGWDSYFLGGNTPPDHLVSLINDKKPDVVGLSLSVYFNMQSLENTIALIRRAYSGLPILIGGQAFRWGGQNVTERYSRLIYVSTIEKLEKLLQGGYFEND